MSPTLSPSTIASLHTLITTSTSGATPLLPGAIVLILDSSDSPLFTHTTPNLTPQTLFPIHSCSKLIGALSFLQLLDRGLASLDDPSLISHHLPELWGKKVLVGVKETEAGQKEYVFEDRRGDITARMLLNHTNGTGMSFFNEELRSYLGPDLASINEGTSYFENLVRSPLLWHPGTRTNYGQGLDWVSVLVERITGESMEDVIRGGILHPLGIRKGGMKGEWGGNGVSTSDGDFWAHSLKLGDGSFMQLPGWGESRVDSADAWPGGKTHVQSVANGLVLSPMDLARIYSVLLPQNAGVDPLSGTRVLSRESAAEVSRPSHDEAIRDNSRDLPSANPVMVPYATQSEDVDPKGWFGLGAAVQGADRRLANGKRGRSKGSVYWHGAANAEFWVDGEKGIVVVAVGNYFPFMEPGWVEFLEELEGGIYEGLEG